MLAAYQARVDYEVGDSITRELHHFLMKHGKGALTREKGSYYLGIAVGTKNDESAFVLEAVKKKNKDIYFFRKNTGNVEEISREEMDSYSTQEEQNKIVKKLFKQHVSQFWKCG